MTEIDREQLKRMMDEHAAVVVEVLSPEQYKDFHICGAINVPLDEDFDEHIEAVIPDKHQPVAVYCMNERCDASPRAAKRMRELGFDRVYDYAAGKMDWKEAGFPVRS